MAKWWMEGKAPAEPSKPSAGTPTLRGIVRWRGRRRYAGRVCDDHLRF
ncbi:MAG: hypothetical protein ABDI19_00205 [Armatimonadota bacterium]